MNTFFRRGINEYQRQIGLKESFAIQTERLQTVLESTDYTLSDGLPVDNRESRRRLKLLLLFPLIEIAWADGCVRRRESDAILKVAEAYGLVENDEEYGELLEKMTARPMPKTVGKMWRDFQTLFEKLPDFERQNIIFCLVVQAQFVAEQSSDNLMSFLRGERVCKDEKDALRIVARQLEKLQSAAAALEEKRNAVLLAEEKANAVREIAAPVAAVFFGEYELEATLDDYGKLIPLVPLVQTAWAEGRITKRERHLVFEAAARSGIKPDTTAHTRLSEWLVLEPTGEFYDSALNVLQQRWQPLDADEKSRRKFDLLGDCTRIAEASGGANHFPSGGARICNEEIAVVKHIAQKLNLAVAA